jgi:hypothetical protein
MQTSFGKNYYLCAGRQSTREKITDASLNNYWRTTDLFLAAFADGMNRKKQGEEEFPLEFLKILACSFIFFPIQTFSKINSLSRRIILLYCTVYDQRVRTDYVWFDLIWFDLWGIREVTSMLCTTMISYNIIYQYVYYIKIRTSYVRVTWSIVRTSVRNIDHKYNSITPPAPRLLHA